MSASDGPSDFADVARQIGLRVRAARKRANLTQEALALKVELDRRTIQQLEYGRSTTPGPDGAYGPSNPQLDTLWRLAVALEISLTELTDVSEH